MKIQKLFALFGAVFLLHTAAYAGQNSSFAVQIPNAKWWQSIEKGDGRVLSQLTLGLPLDSLIQLAKVQKQLQSQTNVRFTLGLSASNEVNAYAKKESGYDLIIVTSGFLLRFGNDPDVLATTIGHELAHHYLGHTDHSHENNTFLGISDSVANNANESSSSRTASQTLYGLVNNNIASNSSVIDSNSFDEIRNQERAADLLGMYWAMQAGYSAFGVYKLAQGLKEIQGSARYLPTHPSNNERMEVAQNFAQHSSKNECTAAFEFDLSPTIAIKSKETKRQLVWVQDGSETEFEIL